MGKRQAHLLKAFRTLGMAILICSVGTGCGMISNLRAKHSQRKRDKAVKELVKANSEHAADRLGAEAVGEVSYVDEESGFVLIRQLVGKRIAPNTDLIAKGSDGRVAQLKANPVAKASFVAADIVKGRPEKGDSVLPDVSKKAEDATAVPPPASDAKDGGNEKKADAGDSPRHKRNLDPLLPPLDPLQPPSDESSIPMKEPDLPR